MSTDVPPFYGDLGKSARDVFSKGFDYPKVKVSLMTDSDSGLEFDTNGSYDLEKSRLTGSMKIKVNCVKAGVSICETWNTSGELLDAGVSYEPPKLNGIKLSLKGSFSPNHGQRAITFGTEYKRQCFSFDGGVTLHQLSGPSVQGAAVFLYKGWYAGYQAGYEVNSAKLTANNIAIGYKGNDFTCHSSCTNLSDCLASVHHKIDDKTEVSLMTNYNVQSSTPGMAVGMKCLLSGGGTVKAKVNHTGQIGLGYSQNLSDGVKLSLSSLVEARNVSTGGHKLGLALDFEF